VVVGGWFGFVGYVLLFSFCLSLCRVSFVSSFIIQASSLSRHSFHFPHLNIHPTIHLSISSPTLALSIPHHLLPLSDPQNPSITQPSYTIILIMTASMSNIMSSFKVIAVCCGEYGHGHDSLGYGGKGR
jgi:hypothetical protein